MCSCAQDHTISLLHNKEEKNQGETKSITSFGSKSMGYSAQLNHL